METNKHFFYVLKCKDGSLYAGYTTDLNRRVRMHNEGKGAKYTRGRGPVSLVFFHEYSTKEEAMRTEYWFKRLSKTKKERIIAKELNIVDLTAKELC
jgi:putative endonuclease